jgi:hypothetical protein
LSLSLLVSINYNHFPTRSIIIDVTAFVILLAGQIGILTHLKTVSPFWSAGACPNKKTSRREPCGTLLLTSL